MKRFVVIFFCLLLFSACGNKSKPFVPDRLLTEQEMIDILTDVHIIEADINYQRNQDREQRDSIRTKSLDYGLLSRIYYEQLFEHYGITDSIYRQNLRYYTEQPATLEAIMDSVTQRLAKEQAK